MSYSILWLQWPKKNLKAKRCEALEAQRWCKLMFPNIHKVVTERELILTKALPVQEEGVQQSGSESSEESSSESESSSKSEVDAKDLRESSIDEIAWQLARGPKGHLHCCLEGSPAWLGEDLC